MLYVCVLIGLDWVEPMMKFLLHVTCSCISHAYVLSFQYTCYIWNCLGLFWLSFFFSLSFCLWLIVSMAPKRKSTPAQNPLRSGASSFSDPTLSHIRFNDDDAFKEFSENFSRWGIHLECQVILSDFTDTNLPTIIHSRGWESLCDMSVTCPVGHLSSRAYLGVLLQHVWDWSFSTSFLHSRSRYAHSYHTATC